MANPITQIIITAVDKTKAAFGSVKGGLSSLGTAASSLRGMLGSLFVGLSAVSFIGQIKTAINAMDDASKSAQKIGTSVENFSALSYAAGQSGVEVGVLEKSLLKLSRSLDDAKSGAGPTAEAFQRLQIDPKQFTDPAEALKVIAERFKSMPDGVNKAALAMDLFGKSGADLIPLLNQGADGIKRMTDEAAAFGVVFSGEAGKAAEEFNDNLDKLQKSGAGLAISLANDMLPGLNELTTVMANAAKQGGITAAILEGIKLGFTDFLDNSQLSATYRLIEAQKQLNALRADGFDEDHHRVEQLNAWIPKLQGLVNAEKALEETRRKNSKDTSKALGENRADETKAFKESINEQISDAKRLQTALQTAFTASLKAEQDYRDEAKKLRAQAAAPAKGEQSQESIRADATLAAMKLERVKANGSPEETRDQAAAVKDLAANLEDAQYKEWLLGRAMLAEAAAAEKSADAEAQRSKGLAEQMNANEARMAQAKKDAEDIGKPVSVDLQPGEQMGKTIEDLERVKHLIDYIKNTPVNLNVSASGGDTSSASLSKAALQYGRRQ